MYQSFLLNFVYLILSIEKKMFVALQYFLEYLIFYITLHYISLGKLRLVLKNIHL